ncbi:hypothetical protein CTRI78_v001092 [Colletotrichum trifolii]|uniref:Uncharacterized protein n=1 Tax=Colletotrichum trifolii TaxID=5466 RepID=A0A4R8RX01_COLTR|nr:hypothetical protein CTRI78_v001092 [Colletotrichum trifolii]
MNDPGQNTSPSAQIPETLITEDEPSENALSSSNIQQLPEPTTTDEFSQSASPSVQISDQAIAEDEPSQDSSTNAQIPEKVITEDEPCQSTSTIAQIPEKVITEDEPCQSTSTNAQIPEKAITEDEPIQNASPNAQIPEKAITENEPRQSTSTNAQIPEKPTAADEPSQDTPSSNLQPSNGTTEGESEQNVSSNVQQPTEQMAEGDPSQATPLNVQQPSSEPIEKDESGQNASLDVQQPSESAIDDTPDVNGSPNIQQPSELVVENEDSQAASSGLNPQAANWAPPVATTSATKTYITEKVKAAPPEPYQPPWMLSIRMYNEIEAVLFLRHPTPYQDALFVPLTRMYTSMLEGAKAMLVVDALEKLIRHNRANEEPAPAQGVAIATDYLWFSHIDEEARTRQSNDLPPLRQCNQEQKVALNRSWGSFVQSLKNATLQAQPMMAGNKSKAQNED